MIRQACFQSCSWRGATMGSRNAHVQSKLETTFSVLTFHVIAPPPAGPARVIPPTSFYCCAIVALLLRCFFLYGAVTLNRRAGPTRARANRACTRTHNVVKLRRGERDFTGRKSHNYTIESTIDMYIYIYIYKYTLHTLSLSFSGGSSGLP